MNPIVRRTYDEGRDFGTKAFTSGCYAPFVSLYFNTLGDVVACCRSQAVVLGNVTRDRITDIWHGPKVAAMREALADYRFDSGCEFCEWLIRAEDVQGATTRTFEGFPVESRNPDYPQQFEFAMSNTCNYACIQCCGDWSSTIRAKRGLPALPRYYGDAFFEELRDYLPHLRRASFIGGEPFLADENYRVWDMMIEAGVKTRCHVLTNGSQWNERVERALDGLDFSVGISMDAISSAQAFERIRVNGKLDTVLTNFERFRRYTRARGKSLAISFSWMRQNWEELGPMLMFAEENGADVHVIRVIDPARFSLFSLPAGELQQIADRLEQQGAEVLPRLKRLRTTWLNAVASVRENTSDHQANGYQHVKSSTRKLRRSSKDIARDLMKEGRWDEAARAALETDKHHKDYIWAVLIAAHSRRREGTMEIAEQLLDQAQAMSNRLPAVFVERAWLRFDQRQFDDGLREALRAQVLTDRVGHSAVGATLHVLAFLYAALGKQRELTETIDRWRAIAPEDPKARSEIAEALRMAAMAQERRSSS